MTIERRSDERLRASMPARLAFGGRYRLRGVVLNISESGAKLALDRSGEVPAEFVLSVCFKRQERHYKAAVQWRRREALGLELKPLAGKDEEWLHGLARPRHSDDAMMDKRGVRLLHLAHESDHAERKPRRAV
jgi:PilZ domain